MAHPVIRIRKFNPASFFDDFYHLCIALLPVLYIIKAPILNISLGTVIILAYIPRSLVYIITKYREKKKLKAVAFFVFYLYIVFRAEGNITRTVLLCVTFVIIYGQLNGSINTRKVRKIIEAFAIINTFLLLLQISCYYLLHLHIHYIPQSIIYEEYQIAEMFQDGVGLYRPSALFLEPSHYAQFCLFALISALFPINGKPHLKKALIIGMGCILTTSGMGIALSFAIYTWYIILNKQNINKKIFTIIKWIPIVCIGILLLSRTSFFQKAIQRVFSSVDGYNAISGRTSNWDDAIGSMHGKDLLFGYGDGQNYKFYLTGLADTIYKYGIIGVILELTCFIYLMYKQKDNYVWCCCITFLALFCVAHLTNYAAHIFYFGMVIADIQSMKSKNIREKTSLIINTY